MRYSLSFLIGIFLFFNCQAEGLYKSEFSLKASDLRASTSTRKDFSGKPCAVILVKVVGVEKLKFKEAIGKIKYAFNEYEIYVPDGTKQLTYQNESMSGKIDLGTRAESNCTYELKLETHKTQVTYDVFVECNIGDALLYVDDVFYGAINTLNGVIRLPEGKHSYRITLSNYKERMGKINVTNKGSSISEKLVRIKSKTKVYKEEETETHISMRGHRDIAFSGQKFLKDNQSYSTYISANFTQYGLKFLTFREGIGLGAGILSQEFAPVFDEYYDKLQSKPQKIVPFLANLNFELGLTFPIDKYNRSFFSVLGGVYGGYYNVGHSVNSLKEEERINKNLNAIYTNLWDWGLRFNALFYINHVLVGAKFSKSFNNPKTGETIGVVLGYKFYIKSR